MGRKGKVWSCLYIVPISMTQTPLTLLGGISVTMHLRAPGTNLFVGKWHLFLHALLFSSPSLSSSVRFLSIFTPLHLFSSFSIFSFYSNSLFPFSFSEDSYTAFGNFGSFFMDFQLRCQLGLEGDKTRTQEHLWPFDSSGKTKQAQHDQLT